MIQRRAVADRMVDRDRAVRRRRAAGTVCLGRRACGLACLSLAILWIGVSGAAAAGWTVQQSVLRRVSLLGVSCTSSRACTAVGQSRNSQPAAEHWDGVRWGFQRTANPAVAQAALDAVSCRAVVCVAVGNRSGGHLRSVNLGERWDGKRWRIERTPTAPEKSAIGLAGLVSVSCPSASDCTAVGSRGILQVAGPREPVAERWHEGRWSVQTLPELPFDFGAGELDGVSCPSVTACVAVGVTPLIGKPAPLPGSSEIPFAERWDGKHWTVNTLPVPAGATEITLGGVSCTSSSACTAVGFYSDPGGAVLHVLAESLNGTSWSIQDTPDPTGHRGLLNAVSCTGPRACTAVGSIDLRRGRGYGRTLAERWNGIRWRIQRTPDPHKAQQPFLTSVSCTRTAACTAVGDYNQPSKRIQGSFVERYS